MRPRTVTRSALNALVLVPLLLLMLLLLLLALHSACHVRKVEVRVVCSGYEWGTGIQGTQPLHLHSRCVSSCHNSTTTGDTIMTTVEERTQFLLPYSPREVVRPAAAQWRKLPGSR